MTSAYANTDCRGGGGEARQPLGTGVFGHFFLGGKSREQRCIWCLHGVVEKLAKSTASFFGSRVLKQATVDNCPVGVRWISGLI